MTDEEYGAFYRASFALLVRQLYAMTGDFGEAQDAVQEAFVRGWDRRGRLSRDEGGPEAWIRTVAWRLAVSRWRRARRGRELEQERMRFAPQVAAAPSLEHTALVAALRLLPAAQRQAVVLHHLCDLSVQQIAAETGAAVGTVKARLSRGRTALAGYLREQPEELTVVEGGRRKEANHCA